MILDTEEQREFLLRIVGLVGISGNMEEVKKALSKFEELVESIQKAVIGVAKS